MCQLNKNNALILALLALSACGGGGGGGGGGSSDPVLLQISAANAVDAAAIGISLIEAPLQLAGAVVDVIDTFSNLQAAPFVANCSNGGEIDFDFTDVDQDQAPSPGDTLRADFRQCYQRSLDTVVDGSLTVTFRHPANGATGFAGEFDATGVAIVVDAGVTARFLAPLNFLYTRDTLEEVIQVRAAGSIDVVIVDGALRVTETFSDLTVRKVIDLVAAEYRITASAWLDDELLGGRFRIETPEPVRGRWNSFPEGGHFSLRGRNGSAVRTAPLSTGAGNSLPLDLDADGDGSFVRLSQSDFWTDIVGGYLWWESRTGGDPAASGFVTRNASEQVFSLAWVNVSANQPVDLVPEIIFQFPGLVDPAHSLHVGFIAQAPFYDSVSGTVEVRGAQVVISTARPLLPGATYSMGIGGGVQSTTGSSVILPGFPVLAATDVLAVPRASLLLAGTGTMIGLLGGDSTTTTGQPLASFAWTQVAGPSVAIENPGAANATVVPDEPGTYTFRLEVSNSAGVSHYRDVSVHVVPDLSSSVAIYFNSSPGDSIGRGREVVMSSAQGTGLHNVYSPRKVDVVVIPEGTGSIWSVLLCASTSAGALTVGNYGDATGCSFAAGFDPLAGLSFSGDGRGCNEVAGTFTIIDIAFAGDGSLLRLAAEFEQRCEVTGPLLRGAVRYHSTVPLVPFS